MTEGSGAVGPAEIVQAVTLSTVMASMTKLVQATSMLALAKDRPWGCMAARPKTIKHASSRVPRMPK